MTGEIGAAPAGIGVIGVAVVDDQPARMQVVRGDPDDLELAALVAGLAAVAGGLTDEALSPPPTAWTDHTRAMRHRTPPTTPTTPGPGAWRWSHHP